MMVGMNSDRIIQALNVIEKQERNSKRNLRLVDDYSMPNVSIKILRIIVSYTDYINQNVWKKLKV